MVADQVLKAHVIQGGHEEQVTLVVRVLVNAIPSAFPGDRSITNEMLSIDLILTLLEFIGATRVRGAVWYEFPLGKGLEKFEGTISTAATKHLM